MLLLLATGGPVHHNRWLLGTGKRSVYRLEGLVLKSTVSHVENLSFIFERGRYRGGFPACRGS